LYIADCRAAIILRSFAAALNVHGHMMVETRANTFFVHVKHAKVGGGCFFMIALHCMHVGIQFSDLAHW